MSEPDIAAALSQAMSQEDRRRQLASQSPGLGALVQLPDVSYGAGPGNWDLGPHVGEGYSQGADMVPQVKSYGPVSPVYADPFVAGVSYSPGHIQTAIRALGERVFAAQDAQAARAGDSWTVISPQVARPSLWRRITERLRRR
jgi:hypothetical protein